MSLTYKDAGVDKESGYREVQLIKGFVKKTSIPGVLSDIGGFSGLFQLDTKAYEEPVLVSGTDGVGTKLKIAFMMDKHDTVGEDCVAMCINDILCQGAKPLFFLDYIATGKLIPEKMAKIVEGVASGCIKAGCALIGGETAEMPGFYNEGEYDIAGFGVGVVEKKKIITGSNIKEGDIVIGLPSSGIHSNGYSLVRKIVFEKKKMDVNTFIPELGTTLGEELIKPTRIYSNVVLSLIERFNIKGISHITGGGFFENIPRTLPEGLTAYINKSSIETPVIFKLLMKWGNIDEKEMYGTFNMGVGMVLIVDGSELKDIEEHIKAKNEKYFILGDIRRGNEGVVLC
ncbi:MAG TPA: phosphoribosylformylglycinamidine cyclo-ligase [Tissierellia bacterium]|nr:phosphoribosylformylglycinamidine cyclo-ligase [Tissierellia bacterium]